MAEPSAAPQSDRLRKIIDCVLDARRRLWTLAVEAGAPVDGFLSIPGEQIEVWERALLAALLPGYANKLMFRSDEGHELIVGRANSARARIQLLETHVLLRAVFKLYGFAGLPSAKLRADCAYHVWRSLRAMHQAARPREVLTAFQRICGSLNAAPEWGGSPQELAARVKGPFASLFLDVCFSLEEIDCGIPGKKLQLRPEWRDAGFLFSRLFGFRTSIPGLDVVFEGGLSLAESPPGRIIVIFGPYGSGKSILSLSLASEVVRKGEDATVIPLDDTAQSLENYLVTFGLLEGLKIIRSDYDGPTGLEGASINGPSTAEPDAVQGAALHIAYQKDVKQSITKLTEELGIVLGIRGATEATDPILLPPRRPPRLIVIDPVNSLLDVSEELSAVRAQLNDMISIVRDAGANLVLVAERGDQPSRPWLDELPYVADTVIELSRRLTHGYDQRYIQVSKSRFQQERRGAHPIAIVPSRGFSTLQQGVIIAPSSPAMLSDMRRPQFMYTDRDRVPFSFGWSDFDELVGRIEQGDSFAFRGQEGSLKTVIALRFLRRKSPPPAGYLRRRSLFLTDRSNRPLKAYNAARALLRGEHESEGDGVDLVPFPSGFVQPGRLLMNLKEVFARARDRGVLYDRVVAANAGRWDLTCPFVRDDLGFGEALLELFQREGASVVFVCAERDSEQSSTLQRVLVDRVAVLVDFERVEHHGVQRVLCRVVRTNSTPGSEDWQEVRVHGGELHMTPSLLRTQEVADRPGSPGVYEVRTELHLYTAEEELDPFMAGTQERLRSVLMTPVQVKKLEDKGALRLGPLSVASDLHIIQIDEYQLPALKASRLLHPFATARWDKHAKDDGRVKWDELDGELRTCMSLDEKNKYFVAVPYYGNLALLALERMDHPSTEPSPANPDELRTEEPTLAQLGMTSDDLRSWDDLRKAVLRPERGLFFDFSSKESDENFNCLFLEILLGFDARGFPDANGEDEGFGRWMDSDPFRKALRCFHDLCSSGNAPDRKVRIARKWYVTLSALEPAKGRYRIMPLPGNVALSGEWYLGVRAHCAVPEVGLRIIIDELTSREAESARLSMREHIGLPTVKEFYETKDRRMFFREGVAIDESVDLWALVTSARRRSEIHRYIQLQPLLAETLKEIAGLASFSDADMQRRIESLVSRTRTVLARSVPPGAPAA